MCRYFVPGRNTKGSFHGSMQSRGGRSARPSILGLGPDRPPQQAGSRMGSEAGADSVLTIMVMMMMVVVVVAVMRELLFLRTSTGMACMASSAHSTCMH